MSGVPRYHYGNVSHHNVNTIIQLNDYDRPLKVQENIQHGGVAAKAADPPCHNVSLA